MRRPSAEIWSKQEVAKGASEDQRSSGKEEGSPETLGGTAQPALGEPGLSRAEGLHLEIQAVWLQPWIVSNWSKVLLEPIGASQRNN